MRVLVIGATGYVASRLVPALLRSGHEVLTGCRRPSDLTRFFWHPDVTPVEVDVLAADQVMAAMEHSPTGRPSRPVDAVVYLVHGMGGADFEGQDRQAAVHVRRAIDAAGVARVVYLSGIVPHVPRDDLSPHLSSRLEVEEFLLHSRARTVSLRASMVLGASSTSFEVLAQVARRLPVTVVPDWMDSHIEPIAVCDVVAALEAALGWQEDSRAIDIGGGEVLRYADLVRRFSRAAGLRRPSLTVPGLGHGLVSLVGSHLVSVPTSTVTALMESLTHDMVADPDQADLLLPAGHRVGIDEAFDRALARTSGTAPDRLDPLSPWPGDPAWATGAR